MGTFVRLTLLVTVAIVALIVVLFLVKILVIAAIVAALVVGAGLIVNALRRRRAVPVAQPLTRRF